MALQLGMLASTRVSIPYEWVAGTGAGYGSAVTSLKGDTYIQTYTTLYKLNGHGNFQWGRSISSSGNWQTVSYDNQSYEQIYATSTNGLIVCYTADGEINWIKSIGFSTIEAAGAFTNGDTPNIVVAGNDGTYGYIACLNGMDGSVIWSKRTNVNIQWQGTIGYEGYFARVNLVGYIQNANGKFDSTYVELDVNTGSVAFQRRIALSGDYSFGQGAKYDPINGFGTVSGYMGFFINWVVQFNSVGSTLFSLKAAMTDSSYLQTGYGTIGFDGDGDMYLSSMALYTNYSPSNWGIAYSQFNGSTHVKTVAIGGMSGLLRLSVAPDKTLGLMTTSGFAKIQHDGTVPLGTYGSYTVRENPTNFTYTASGLSISSDSVSYVNAGLTTTTPSNSVSSAGSQPSITYIG